jgi:hypothetical protein
MPPSPVLPRREDFGGTNGGIGASEEFDDIEVLSSSGKHKEK